MALGAAAAVGLGFFGVRGWRWLTTEIQVEAEREIYGRHEFVQILARPRTLAATQFLQTRALEAEILREGKPVTTIGGRRRVRLLWDEGRRASVGKWPAPWNAEAGEYEIALRSLPAASKPPAVRSRPFEIRPRPLPEMPPGFGVLTLESLVPLSQMKVPNPKTGAIGDWRNLLDWAEFVGADAFWYSAGFTWGKPGRLDEAFPFEGANLHRIAEMGRLAHERGLKFGVWIICYLTYGDRYKNYFYAWDRNADGGWYATKSISLADAKRPEDLARLVRILAAVPEVDYIGLDYIRNALGGYELAEPFVEEMGLSPAGWERMSRWARMDWLWRQKVYVGSPAVVEDFQWWRAHRASRAIERVRREMPDKPLWTFLLSWEKGWQHGQDPLMFSDAGADYNAVMLYEANRKQFDNLLLQWGQYLKAGQANLLVGDVIDWPLHQRTLSPSGPEEFYDRLVKAVDGIHSDGIPRGMFLHDLGRAIWGRLGPYTTQEWLLAGAAALSHLRLKHNVLAVETRLEAPEKISVGEEAEVRLELINHTQKPVEVEISWFVTPQAAEIAEAPERKETEAVKLGRGGRRVVAAKLKALRRLPQRAGRIHLAARAACRAPEGSRDRRMVSVAFRGLNVSY